MIIKGTNADNDITVVGTDADDFTVSVDGGPAVQYVNMAELTVDAMAGDDDIDGGVGVDAIMGGEGDDDLFGDAGSDVILGGFLSSYSKTPIGQAVIAGRRSTRRREE